MSSVQGDIEHDVRQLIADVTGRTFEELAPDKNFWTDLGVDSIKAIEITVAIERKYKISIRDEEIPQIATVGQAILTVKKGLEKKGSK